MLEVNCVKFQKNEENYNSAHAFKSFPKTWMESVFEQQKSNNFEAWLKEIMIYLQGIFWFNVKLFVLQCLRFGPYLQESIAAMMYYNIILKKITLSNCLHLHIHAAW